MIVRVNITISLQSLDDSVERVSLGLLFYGCSNPQRDHVMILCMNHRRHAESPSRQQDVQDLTVVQLQRIVCHVEFDASDTHLFHNPRKLII